MGMITKVRGRLRSLHTLSKLGSKERDEKIAETVCLLSVLFLLPYCSRGHAPLLFSLGGWCLATYSFLVLPVLISANYRYPVRWLRRLSMKISDLILRWYGPIWKIFCRIYEPLDRCEKIFMKMSNISNLTTQLVFFMMCDRVLLCHSGTTDCPRKNKTTTGLYSLMFYNVIAYCAGYIKELAEKEDWSVTVRMTKHSRIRHVAMSATKTVLEWTKAVTFVITVTFMLLVFGMQQGLQHYRPTVWYTAVTWTYYMCTEKVFADLLLPLLVWLRLEALESLEPLHLPVLLRGYTITVAFTTSIPLAFHAPAAFTALALYLTVYLRAKDTAQSCLGPLRAEQAALGRFRRASGEEIRECDDVCAVCLGGMQRARVTPCQHMFHAGCLRQCLKGSSACPICKREFTFVR